MVGRFVHQQPTAVLLFAMPAPEIIRPVARVQHPRKIDRQWATNCPLHNHIAQLGIRRRITVIERHAQRPAGFLNRLPDRLQALDVGRHWLFADHVAAQFHPPRDVLVVRPVNSRHDHHVRLRLSDHPVKVCAQVRRHRRNPPRLQPSVVPVHPRLAHIAESNEFRILSERLRNRLNVHPGARARPHNGITFPLAHLVIHLRYCREKQNYSAYLHAHGSVRVL